MAAEIVPLPTSEIVPSIEISDLLHWINTLEESRRHSMDQCVMRSDLQAAQMAYGGVTACQELKRSIRNHLEADARRRQMGQEKLAKRAHAKQLRLESREAKRALEERAELE